MRLTKEQLSELITLCKPIGEFLKEHGNPHCTVFVTQQGVTAVEDVAFSPFDEKTSIRKVE